MNKNQIETIIFDMDGTIIDTEAAATLAVRECLHNWNIPYTEEDSQFVTGRTWESAYTFLFQKYKFPVPAEEARATIIQHYRNLIDEKLIVVPGSVEAIRSLSLSYPLGLVSGSYRSEILWAVRKLGIESCFKVLLGAEDYPRSKPYPDGFEKALGVLGGAPDQCMVFEDSQPGIESARRAGLWVVAITSTNHFKQDQTRAHHWIKNLEGVTAEWVKGLPFP